MSTALVLGNPGPDLARQAGNDEQAIRLWLHGKAEHSKRAYRKDVERFLGFVHRSLTAVGLQDLQDFSDSLNDLAPATQKRILAAVKSLLTFCLKIGYCQYNVGGALTIKKVKNTIAERILSHEEVLRIIDREEKPRNKAVLRFLYETGCRASELCEVRWKDTQERDSGGQITLFGKGGKTRHVLISERLYKELLALRVGEDQNQAVFVSKGAKAALDQPAVFRIVRSAAKRAGIKKDVSPHWFRHAAASHAIDNGCPLSLVREQLGHASLETTSIYTHARPTDGLFRYLR